jgi:hypothetical protein
VNGATLYIARIIIMKATRPSIEDSFHLVFGPSAAGSLKVAGFKRCLVLYDRLCAGRCDQNPIRHLRKRRSIILADGKEYEGPKARDYRTHSTYWAKAIIGARQFAAHAKREAREQSVVLWTTPTWRDRAAFWWMLDALQHAEIDWKRFWVVDVRFPHDDPMPLGSLHPEELSRAFGEIEPLSAAADETNLWQEYASPSPLDFDRSRRTTPWLRRMCEPYGTFFPQVKRNSSLHLCLLDQMLLDTLEISESLRPIDFLRKNHRLMDVIVTFGDLLIIQRLRAWAKHGMQPALLKRREKKAVNEFTAVSFQLTDHGARVRDEGLQMLEEAPPLLVGGCRLYEDPWVRRNRGRDWLVERLDESNGTRGSKRTSAKSTR